MDALNISVWVAGLIFIAIDGRTIRHVELSLRCAAKSFSLLLLAILNLRLAVCPVFLWLISTMKLRLAQLLRRCDARGETHEQKNWKRENDPSEVNLSAFMHLVTQSLENTSHIVECISSFLKSLFFLCSAVLHLFQGSLYLFTALVHCRNSVIVLVCAAAAYYNPKSWLVIILQQVTEHRGEGQPLSPELPRSSTPTIGDSATKKWNF